MFQEIRHRLLISYLGVFTLILGVFAIAVRATFAHSLRQQLTEQLITLGQGAASSIEFINGRFQADTDFSTQDLIARKQALQWFDLQGNLLGQQGEQILTLPLPRPQPNQQSVQTQAQIQGVTLPVVNSEISSGITSRNDRLIGYVRASQSSQNLDDTLQRLDWGLEGGVLTALILSSLGGIWLTRQAMQPIEKSFQRLQQFTADASHELRSPLMAIKSNAAVALKYPEGIREADAEKFQAIASATRQMTRLTEDLLLLARNDRHLQRDWQDVNLTSLLQHLVQLYQPQADTKQIDLKSDIAELLHLTGDTLQLTHLFTNLIVNALQYTPEKGAIEICAYQRGTHILVNVQDTGIGISPEHLEDIFDRFWRADSSRSHESGGAGLGLAIAQNVAQMYDGSISVQSQLGDGSCFTVLLPIKSPKSLQR